MEELSFKRIILKTQNGLFVSAKPQGSYNMIFLTPEIGNAIIWNIRKGKICDESCQLFWDVWDETNPRLTMYRDGGGNNYNQLWNIYSHENDDEIIIYSRNENVHNRGINYSESKKAILFEREPRPFRIVPLEKAVSTLQPTGIISKTETKEIDNALKLRSTYVRGH